MTSEFKVLIGIATVTIGLFVGAIWWLSGSQVAQTGPADLSKLITPESARIGSDSAKVTLVEFGDYQCPSCAVSHPVVVDILATYPTQVSFVFRHFPLSQHPLAPLAAAAAEAAGEQGKYWEMHNALYEHQSDWSTGADPAKIFEGYASSFNLDVTKFSAALSANKSAGKIQQGLADGTSLGVDSTPTFYINGLKFSGPLDSLKAAVDTVIKAN